MCIARKKISDTLNFQWLRKKYRYLWKYELENKLHVLSTYVIKINFNNILLYIKYGNYKLAK